MLEPVQRRTGHFGERVVGTDHCRKGLEQTFGEGDEQIEYGVVVHFHTAVLGLVAMELQDLFVVTLIIKILITFFDLDFFLKGCFKLKLLLTNIQSHALKSKVIKVGIDI